MATAYGNRVCFLTPTTGTGTLNLGAAVAGYQLPAAAGIITGSTVGYTIDDATNWETGTGVYTTGSPATLTRASIEDSSASGAAINLSGNAIVTFVNTAVQLTGFATTASLTPWAASPPAIGGSTPAAGAFTTLSATSTVSGTGFSNWAASPPAIGGSTPAAGAFTTLSATSTVSGTGFSDWAASPPAIGGSTPAGGAFTTIAASSTISGTGFVNWMTAPGPIGSGTASTGAFTTLSATSTVSGAGFTTRFAKPGPIGSTTASTGAFTTLSASSTVSGTGFTNLLAAPGPIGSSTPGTGAFTTLAASSTVSGTGFTNLLAAPGPIGSSTPGTGAFTTLSSNTPSAGDNTTNAATTAFVQTAIVPTFNNVGRNKLHNPLFNVAQRGPGPFTTNAAYTLDRWQMILVTDSASVSQVALADADRTAIADEEAQYAFQNVFTGNAAIGAYNYVRQPIENVRRLGGDTVTISFWGKAASGTPKVGVSIDQWFGTGGSPSAAANGNGTAVTLSTTWTRYSVTLAVPSTSGKTLGSNSDHYTTVNFWFSSGSTNATRAGSVGVQSGTVTIWGGQSETGSVMTALEKPDPAMDLANCQRFFQTMHVDIWGYGGTGNGFAQRFSFPVTMRAAPTTGGIVGGSTNNASGQAIDSLTNDGFRATAVIGGTGGAYWTGAQEYFSADL